MVLTLFPRRSPSVFVQGKNLGHLLEDSLLQRLQNIHGIERIYHEDSLKALYGWDAASVDYLIEIREGVIPVQCRWRYSRRRETKGVTNYLKSVEYLQHKTGKPVLFGLWICRLAPFQDNVELLSNYKIMVVNHFDSIDQLVDIAQAKLQRWLQQVPDVQKT